MTPRTPTQPTAVLLIARLLAAVLAGALCLAPSLAWAKPAEPQLSIDVDNGKASTTAGDKLDYTITVTNLGTSTVNLVVTQSVPAGASFRSADARGQHRAGTVSWPVTVKATGKVSLRSGLVVKAGTPRELLRLATVTCARLKAPSPPLVCASDSDLLPAGAAAQTAATKTISKPLLSELHLPYIAGGAGLVLAALVVLVFLRRRVI